MADRYGLSEGIPYDEKEEYKNAPDEELVRNPVKPVHKISYYTDIAYPVVICYN